MGEKEDVPNEDFKYIVRIANTDIVGEKAAVIGIQNIKGVGKRVAEIIISKTDINPRIKMGDLSDENVAQLEELVLNFANLVPEWTLNRQVDYSTGEDIHLIGNELDMTIKDDVNRMKMIRCYRGVRHEHGHKSRGQRTRSNGRTGLTLGVSKRKGK